MKFHSCHWIYLEDVTAYVDDEKGLRESKKEKTQVVKQSLTKCVYFDTEELGDIHTDEGLYIIEDERIKKVTLTPDTLKQYFDRQKGERDGLL